VSADGPLDEAGGPPASPGGEPTRAGYAALLGLPNVGKSTLLNAFLGTKLSIVTPKAQTTWQRVTGIRTTARAQTIFLDTPGLLEARDLLQRSMLESAHEALAEADVVVLVLDATRPADPSGDRPVQEALDRRAAPLLVAVNKVDEARPEAVAELVARVEAESGGEAFPVSALEGEGVDELAAAIEEALPVSPFLYPPDDLASQPVRFFLAELVRETVFEDFREEIPYSVFCRVEDMREDQDPVYVQATLYVERPSQKGILIGERGSAIKALGTRSRRKMEHFLGRSVYLDLWVKPLPGWRRKRRPLARLGFHVPEEHDQR